MHPGSGQLFNVPLDAQAVSVENEIDTNNETKNIARLPIVATISFFILKN